MRLTNTKETRKGQEPFEYWLKDSHPLGQIKAIERLADYEDAEEQGLLKMLPCRVGDTVFLVQYGKMYERKVNGFSVTSNNQLVIHIPDFEMDNASFPEHTFGKFVFFDRKKAESALAEKGGAE